MKAQDILVHSLKMDQNVWMMLLDDLSDADLLVRPVPGANHLAWQLGHILSAECRFLKELGVTMPNLPANFDQQHSKEMSQVDPPKGFLSKGEYINLFKTVRAATVAACVGSSDADLDKANPGRMAEFAPTFGALYALVAAHATMHVGQASVLRRKLGKSVKF